MNPLNCDPFKVRAFYKEQKNLVDLALLERTDSEKRESIKLYYLKAGKIVNSYPSSK